MSFTSLVPRAVLKTPGTVFPIRTSQLANNIYLLYLSVSTSTMIGSFCGPYFTAQNLKVCLDCQNVS